MAALIFFTRNRRWSNSSVAFEKLLVLMHSLNISQDPVIEDALYDASDFRCLAIDQLPGAALQTSVTALLEAAAEKWRAQLLSLNQAEPDSLAEVDMLIAQCREHRATIKAGSNEG